MLKTGGQFGKEIASNQVPGWSAFYLDYKGLKKIVSSLVKEKTRVATSPPITTATPASIVVSIDPAAILDGSGVSSNNTEITLLPSSGQDADRGPHFQKCKTKFFFKLQRELEKVRGVILPPRLNLNLPSRSTGSICRRKRNSS